MVLHNRVRIRSFILLFVFSVFCVFLSEDANAYEVELWIHESEWNRSLVNLKIGDNIGDFTNYDYRSYSVLASSCLKPEGEKWIREDDDVRDRFYVGWSTLYEPYCAYDNNLNTAWSEGVPGDGVGEVLIYPLCDNDRIENENLRIFTGYAKSKDLWLKNNRPRNIKIFVLKSTKHSTNINIPIPTNITVIDEQYATLKDVFDW